MMKKHVKLRFTKLFLAFCMCWTMICSAFPSIAAEAVSTDYPVQLVRITSADGSKDLTADGTSDRSRLSLQTASGSQAQNWRMDYVNTDANGSFYKLCNMGSGRILTPDYYSVQTGTNCVVFGSESAQSQHWYILPVQQDARGNDLYYKIVNYSDTSLALTAGSNGITLQTYSGSSEQKWMLQSSGLQGFGGYCTDMNGNPKASTIGGLLGETVEVTTFDELKKACSDSTPRTIVITKNISCTGTYTTDSNGRYRFNDGCIYLWPNKTIIGSYNAHELYNVYFRTYEREDYGMGKNIIIRNIEISHDKELNNDNVWDFAYGENFWIDHCTFVGHNAVNSASSGQVDWDKFLTFKGHMDYITISDCKFGLHEYGLLMGHPADDEETMAEYNNFPCITLTDNYFNQTLTRAPGLMRYGYFHSLNNYVTNFDLGYTMHTCAKIYTESCYYDGGSGKGSVVNDDASQITNITNPTVDKIGPWYTDSGSVAVNCYRSNNLANIVSASCSWRPSSNYTYKTLSASEAKAYTESNSGAKSKTSDMTYVTFAVAGMPSASLSAAPSDKMPSGAYTKTGAVMDTSVKYMFKNVNSGLYMEVEGAAAANGTNVQQWGADADAVHNTWKLMDAGDGYYYIRSCVGDGKTYYLDLDYGKTDDGTNIGIYAFTDCDAQKFKFVDNGDGTYTITTKATDDDSCIGIEEDSAASGANVLQWTRNGSDSQKWTLETITIKDGAVLDESTCYMIQNVNSGRFMEVQDGTAADDANVQQWAADTNQPAAHNVWRVRAINWGYYTIYSGVGDGNTFLLNVDNGNNGTNITIHTNNKQSTQYFKFVDNEDGTYTIVTRASKDLSCVEVASASTQSGGNVQQWEWNDNNCQKWKLIPVDYTLPFQTTTATTTTTTSTTTTTTKTTTTTATTASTAPSTTSTTSTTTTTTTTASATTVSSSEAASETKTTTASSATSTAETTTTTSATTTASAASSGQNTDAVIYGDTNLDNAISLIDVVILNKHLANSVVFSPQQKINADCCADGILNSSDTTALIRFIVELIHALPVIPDHA